MRYQLVIQFPATALADFDALVALEDKLIADLAKTAKVDGHDFGSGQANIFIFTSDPDMTFWKIRQLLKLEKLLDAVTAAYRPADGENYTVIWPKDSKKRFSIV